MDVYAIDPLFADYRHAILPAWFCAVASIYFAFSRPAANALLPLSLVGMGGAPMLAGLSYGKVSAVLAAFTLIILANKRTQQGGLLPRAYVSSSLGWFAVICLVILTKISVETLVYGLDETRSASLQRGLTEAFFPVLVVLLAQWRCGPHATQRDLLIGMVTFPVLTVMGYLPFALREGLLTAAWESGRRFTLGGADTINSARVLTYGAIALLLLSSKQRFPFWRYMQVLAALLMAFLIVLSGNRQYLFALVLFLILSLRLIQSKHALLIPVASIAVACICFGNAFLSSDMPIRERLSITAFQTEAQEGRGAIWANAFEEATRNPILGTGFKNFGAEFAVEDRSGTAILLRDSAHGVLQEVITEHGLLLGIAFTIGCMQLARQAWSATSGTQGDEIGPLSLAFLALLLPLIFSSGFLNATALHLLLLLTLGAEPSVRACGRFRADARSRTVLPPSSPCR